jgi:hypothetical protein
MIENEIERCRVVEYRRAAAISTGVPSADDQRKQAAGQRQPFYCREDHDGARHQADTHAKKESSAKADGVGNRAS